MSEDLILKGLAAVEPLLATRLFVACLVTFHELNIAAEWLVAPVCRPGTTVREQQVEQA